MDAETEQRKRALFGGLHSSILETGPGTGPNLRFLPADVQWVGVEPNPFMYPYLVQSIRALGRPGENFRRFAFIEHVAAPTRSRLRWLQDFIQPLWSFIGCGCRPNRETWIAMSQAGFMQVNLEHYNLPEWGPAGPHIAGWAVN